MGNPFGAKGIVHLEHDLMCISGFIAIDGAHNVIGQQPVATAPGAGPYTLCKGLSKAIGFAGSVVTQPYQSVGFYQFTLDEPWMALVDYDVNLLEQGAVAIPSYGIKANVRSNTTAVDAGRWPGTDPTVPAQTIQLKFRSAAAGALADIAVSTGFWLRLFLKRTAVP